MSEIDSSIKFFNTAIIATKIPKTANCSQKLNALVQSAAFQVILKSIQDYSKQADVSEELAAEEIVKTFREIDKIWDEYIFQEGLEKLRGHLSQ